DAVLWACVGHCLHGFYILGVHLVAVFLDEREPILPEGAEVRPARNQRDVLAGEGKLCAEVAANGAGADNRNSHASPAALVSPQFTLLRANRASSRIARSRPGASA